MTEEQMRRKMPVVNVQIYSQADKIMELDDEIEKIQQERGLAKAPSRSQIINEAIAEWLERRNDGGATERNV